MLWWPSSKGTGLQPQLGRRDSDSQLHFLGINLNFKKRKTKRNVRCTLCTPNKWKGNNAGRFKSKEEYTKKELKKIMLASPKSEGLS